MSKNAKKNLIFSKNYVAECKYNLIFQKFMFQNAEIIGYFQILQDLSLKDLTLPDS